MSDNFSIATGTTTTIAADDIGGVQYPRVKISVGAPDAATDMTGGAGAVAAGTPRVTLASDDPAVAKLNGGLPAALATGGGLKVTVQDSNGTALDYSVPALVEGGIAHDSPVASGKPVMTGARAATGLPTAVADADVTRLMADKYGRLIARATLRESLAAAAPVDISGTTATVIVAADASNKNDLYGLVLANTSTTNPVKAVLSDDTTAVATFQIPAGDTRGFMLSPDAAIPQAVINKAWKVTLSGTSPTVSVSAMFVKAGA